MAPAVYRTSLFTFPDCASLEAAFSAGSDRYLYSRVSNPTVRVLEEKVASLERTDDALALASGMAAVTAVFLAYLGKGAHLVLGSKAYGPTLKHARDLLQKFGVSVTRVDPGDASGLEAALCDDTRLVYLESPASLTFEITDLEAAAAIAGARGIPTVVDNSWATPLFQRPAELGIDLSLHSGTKYVGGHSDILLGLIAGGRASIARIRRTAILLGASLSPEDAFLAIRGLRTLGLRMERHQASAIEIARRLRAHPRVKTVLHPALEDFPTHALWKRQFAGSSGLFALRLDGDTRRFCDALEVFGLGVSWGGHESLAVPAAVLPEVTARRPIRDDIPHDLIRLSIGLEDVEDLWADLERGFAACGGTSDTSTQ